MLYALDLPIYSGVGGNFTAIDSNNHAMQLDDYKGKVVVLAFGYTNCADICPFTLGYLKGVYEQLTKQEQKQVQIMFVTVDPDYDTAKQLSAYVHYFNQDFIGITGKKSQINNIVALFQAQYHALSDQPIETQDMRRIIHKSNNIKEKAQLFTHSITIYILDKQSRVRALEYTGTTYDDFNTKIRQLIHEN